MLGEAATEAKARAEKLAQATGSNVGALRSAQQGVFQITPENSTSISDYGEYDASQLEQRERLLQEKAISSVWLSLSAWLRVAGAYGGASEYWRY